MTLIMLSSVLPNINKLIFKEGEGRKRAEVFKNALVCPLK